VAAVPASESRAIILSAVRTQAAAVLGHSDAETIGASRAFQDMGFDSLMAVELCNRLNAATGLKLPATLLFNYPTPEAVARYVADALRPPEEEISSSALAELERFHTAYSGTPMGADERALVLARLRQLLISWADGSDEGPEAGLEEWIQAATADEVLAFIDRDL
jgi:acyl carrier protein